MMTHFRPFVLGAVLALSFSTESSAQGTTQRTPTPNDTLVSPEIHSDYRVTFRIYAPKAAEVALRGDWMETPGPVKLEKNEQGVWAVILGPLVPDFYGYSFTVDGVRTLDPKNPTIKQGISSVDNMLVVINRFIAPVAGHTKQGTVERIKVYGKSLEGNLDGDSPDRDVSIYLPPSYKTEKNRRYPVIYMLHGFTDDDAKWFGAVKHWINFPEVINKALADGKTREMIVVMPNAFTRFKGSMYSSSVTVGDWETFIARELVGYIDAHYRTLAQRDSRGLAGHSMGGYGTMRLGMKSPDVFSSIYALSPCCMEPGRANPANPATKEMMKKVEAIKTDDEVKSQSFFALAMLASAAAWSPNPKNPPFYIDLPFRDGEPVTEVQARQSANATLVMIHQYIPNLKRLKAIGLDAGTKDMGISGATKELDKVLTDYGIAHFYESYDGDHLNRIAERLQTKALPFFSEHLSFEKAKR